jgi:transposase
VYVEKKHGETEFVIESTSTYHRPVVHALHGAFKPIIVNPILIGQTKKKADKYDAVLLAYHGLTGIWAPSYMLCGRQHDLTVVSRRLIKATQQITRAANAIGTRLIDANLLLPREIQMKSASAQAIVQAIAEGVTSPVEAVNRAPYYAEHLDMPERQATYDRLLEALTVLPAVSSSVRQVLSALLADIRHWERQCLLYRQWMYTLLQHLTVTSPDGRVLTGEALIALLRTIPGVGTRYGEVLLAEAGLDVVARFGKAQALEAFAGFDPSKTYSADKVLSSSSRKGNKHLHSTTIQIAQSILQHGKRQNPLATWGRAYKMRQGGTTGAHNQAVSAVGKRIVRISYHILRTGLPYDGSQYNFTARQTNVVKQLRRVSTRVHDLVAEIHQTEVDDTARAIATDVIHAFSSLAGIEGGFTLKATTTDVTVEELGFSTRTVRVLQKAGITTLSMLWFRLIQGTLLEIKGVGKKSYEDIVNGLVASGRILKK